MSRIRRLKRPSADLALQAVEALAGPISERGVRVEIEPYLPIVCVDCQRVVEVFQNLIENAIKYMGDQAKPTIRISAEPVQGMVVVCVKDNGMGIEPAYHDRIFGLFDQLDPKIEGTGIGLALTRRIVEVHGGKIWVESEGASTGSCFCFTIPAAHSQVVSETPRSSLHSTVTLLARLRGLSTSQPRATAMW